MTLTQPSIPVVFQWTLSPSHTLENCRVLRLPANPLSISIPTTPEPTLLVAVDSAEGSTSPTSLLAYTPADEACSSWTPKAVSFDESAAEGTVLEISSSDAQKIFYTTDHLRKNKAEMGGEEDI